MFGCIPKASPKVKNWKHAGSFGFQLAPPLVVTAMSPNSRTWLGTGAGGILMGWVAERGEVAFEPVNCVQLTPWFVLKAVPPNPVTTM